ncbi:hypothetical protein FBU59_001106 [Linderina macrospora]|uniref:Uncharacterized protein n=1 Tax=Linderina macrospora TaxID=4868 RepID=A0ACC1JF89_9FUNG|nr:hypothetical protein FBU59_001106 [Linderina macrospora]
MSNSSDYFSYTPASKLPIIAAALFAVFIGVLTWQTIRFKAPKWVYILVGTALAEAVGFIIRAAIVNEASLGLFVTMTLFLLLPPNALALFNYRVIGEVVRRSRVPTTRFWLKPKFITWFFFGSDVFSFLVQSSGGGMMAMESMRDKGKHIALFGLAVQLVFFACFMAVTIVVKRNPQYRVECGPKDRDGVAAKKKLMGVIISTTALLYVRSIYRVAEFADGYGGKIYSCEWAFYVFDSLAILLCFVIYSVWFVGHHFPSRTMEDTYLMHST